MPSETPFRTALIVIAVLQIAISVFYLKKSKAGSTIFRRRDEGILLTVLIGAFYLVYGLGFLAYVVDPIWMAWSALPIPAWIRWSGMLPLLLGAVFLLWGLHHLGKHLTISISTKEQHALITSGPYSWVRHPLYTGGMVESVGVALLMANWFVALSAGCFWALIAYRTPMEEDNLIETFGDTYRQYMRRVGRFLPSRIPSDE